jgi:hypothetical protein
MPVMFWYFPLIVFSGACDIMLSQHNHRRNLPQQSARDSVSIEAPLESVELFQLERR